MSTKTLYCNSILEPQGFKCIFFTLESELLYVQSYQIQAPLQHMKKLGPWFIKFRSLRNNGFRYIFALMILLMCSVIYFPIIYKWPTSKVFFIMNIKKHFFSVRPKYINQWLGLLGYYFCLRTNWWDIERGVCDSSLKFIGFIYFKLWRS